jgi:hydrogenase nickel incorporation protein HypA/HybF
MLVYAPKMPIPILGVVGVGSSNLLAPTKGDLEKSRSLLFYRGHPSVRVDSGHATGNSCPNRGNGAVLGCVRGFRWITMPLRLMLGPRGGDHVHELSLMEDMLRIIEESVDSQTIGHVRIVLLEVGKLAGVEVEALRFAFDAVAQGSILEGAILEIEEPQGMGWCGECEQESPVETRYDPCPICTGIPLKITGGAQMRVKSLEVE